MNKLNQECINEIEEKEQKLLPRFAQSYWDIMFQLERQSNMIKNNYLILNNCLSSRNKYSKK